MDAIEYFQQVRDTYVDGYRSVLRTKRQEGAECTPEVWVDPSAPPGEDKPPHALCIDIMMKGKDGPAIAMVTGEPAEGGLIGILYVRDVPVKTFAAAWEACPVWVRHHDPDWTGLAPWQKKWMDPDRSDDGDEDGLHGTVHYLGNPTSEGGGFLYQLDFGSAPVDALMELLQALAEMGVSEMEIGRSDGSDLPPYVQDELRQPELSVQSVASVVGQLLAELDEVESVEQRVPEQLEVHVQGGGEPRRVFLGNLHRLLQRTGVEARAKEVYRFMRGQRESMAPQTAPDLSQLRLVVKDNRFFENIMQHAPKMKPLVKQSLAADLWFVCVWDQPNGMRFVTDDEPGTYGMSPEEMLARARANFLKARPPVEISEHGPLLVARTGDCYDATLLADDDWWKETAAKVTGDLLACVPARHVVLIGGTGNAGALGEMREAARRIEVGGDHLITDTILLRREGKWEEFQSPDEPMGTDEPTAPPGPEVISPKRPWWRFW